MISFIKVLHSAACDFNVKKMWYLTVFSILCILINSTSSNDIKYTLSGNSKPLNYDLWLTIDVDQLTFKGTVHITLEVVKPTKAIEVDFEIPAYVSFNSFNDGIRQIGLDSTISIAPQIQFVFTEDLTINKEYVLSLSFYGVITDDLKGLYRSNYFDSTGTQR